MDKKTPLYDRHVALGGRMVSYAGYLLPVQYKGVIEEHMAVREKAGLFDVSHMGEVSLIGKDALLNLNRLLTNDFTSLAEGKVRYSVMCNENGGVVDDVLVYRLGSDNYLVVVNAANREKDVRWMQAHLQGDVQLNDVSDDYAQLALQGPKSKEILSQLTDQLPEKYYSFIDHVTVLGHDCLISQTGYTGEFGYEIYCAPEDAGEIWDALLQKGAEQGIMPCALGARDTLRLEAAMPLYGHEMDEDISPLETGLGFAVKTQKESFIGKDGLHQRGTPGTMRVGLKVTGKGIIREGHELYIGQTRVGKATSGTHLPYLGGAYAMALVDIGHSEIGTEVEADVRGRRVAAEIIPLPFYQRSK